MEKLIVLFKKLYNWLWISVLLTYSLLILAFLVLRLPPLPTVFILPFYLFIPGYAVTGVLLTYLSKPEKVIISIGLSLAFFTGVKALMTTFNMTSLFSEHVISAIFSVTFFTVRLFRRK